MLTLRNCMVIKAIVCAFFALAFLLIPETSTSWFGLTLDPGGVLAIRMWGKAYTVLGILLLLARDVAEPAIQKAFATAVLVGDTIGVVVCLQATLAGTFNTMGWIPVLLNLVLAAAFGYILVAKLAATPTP
jgi:hypothetical protein